MRKYGLLIACLFPLCVVSQSSQWTKTWGEEKSFIENRGQFESMYSLPDRTNVLYAYEGSQENYFFSKNKLLFRFVKLANIDKDENEFKEMREKKYTPEEWRRHEVEEFRKKVMQEYVSAEWLDANPNVEIIAENRVSYYHSYTYKINGKLTNVNYIPSFEKMRYKNLYPNIDVIYEFHPQGGIKYSIIVYPGGDLSRVKLKYSKPISLNKNGDIYVKAKFGTIIEHAPISFYDENHQPITSFYSVKDNTISFNVPQSETNNTIVIDPWTQTPFATASNGTWECETDAAGNAYIIGDGMLAYEKLKKYNTTGALQWTYTTTWDTTGYWLGTLGTDLNGNSYITAGSIAEIEKVNTGGSMQFHQNGGSMDEYWAITFNCDQTKLIVGGTRLNGLMTITGNGVIFDISTTNGNVLGIANVGAFKPAPPLGMVNYAEEVRSMSAAYNAKYYYLTLDTIGAITQNFSQCPSGEPIFAINHTYQFSYKSENFRPENGNGANMAIKANSSFVYTQNGTNVHKRSLMTGAILGNATIPGGSSQSTLGEYQPDNNGVALDDCGNVYIGSTNQVLKYDANLTQLNTAPTTYKVSDVAVGTGGSVIVCGTTGSAGSNNRVGYVQSVDMSACTQTTMICCDANVCPADPLCTTDAPITLIGGTSGGTWSGTGITNPTAGTFDPSVAGPGQHTVYYTLPCGTDSTVITVSACAPITVCYDGTGLQATGGSATIQWQTQSQTTIMPTTQAQCTQCGGTWLFGICTVPTCTVMAWSSYASGNTAATPSSWPLLVTDGTDSLIYYALSNIPSCGTCTPPTLSNIVTHETCAGLHNGAINLTVTGSSTYTYSWTGPSGFTATTQDISNLTPGTYNVTVTDATNATCTATASITVNAGTPNPTPTISGSTTFCTGSSTTLDAGSGYSSYLWNTSSNSQTITVNTAGPYSVTVTNASGCSGTASVTVTQSSSLSPTITGTLAICSGNSTILDAGIGFANYLWNTTANTQTITVTTAGTYSVTVSDASGCTGTTQVTVSVATNPTPTITGNTNICAGSSTTLDAGSGYSSYLWNTSSNSQTITVNTAGSYSVTVTNASGCSGTASVTVNVTSTPNANAGINDSTCGLTYQLNAVPSGGSTGIWTAFGPGSVNLSLNTDAHATATVSNNGTYTFIWTETVSGNCTGSDSVLITFLPTPTSNFTATPISCSGGSSTINYTGNANANATFNWNWGGGIATPGNGIGPHQVTWNTPGTYTVSLTVSQYGCTSNATSVQIVNPDGMNTSISHTDIPCYGQSSGSLNLTVTGGTVPYSYHWSNGATIEDQINIIAGNYYVTVTDFNGCTRVDSATITSPGQLIISVTPSQFICSGQSVTLNITATGGTAPYIYYWNNQISSPSITVTPQTTTIYSAYITDANGCNSNTVNTTITVSAPIHVELLQNTDYVCPGDMVELSPTITGGVLPYTVYNQNGSPVTPPIYVYPNFTTYYWVMATDACGSSDSAGVTIHVYSLPPAGALADSIQGCVPLTVHFIEVNPDSGQSYLWNFGDQSNLSLAKNPTHTYTSPGTYTVTLTVTSIHGCKTVVTYTNMINVYPIPNAQFIWNPDYITEVYPFVQFENQSTLANSYMWFFGDGDSSNTVNPEHQYHSIGSYNVLLVAISNRGCRDTARASLRVSPQYTFYAPTAFSPNDDGFNDLFYVMAHSIEDADFSLKIFDRWGEVIWSTDKFFKDNERSEAWDGKVKGGKLAPVGTYTWKVIFKDLQYIKHEESGPVTIIR